MYNPTIFEFVEQLMSGANDMQNDRVVSIGTLSGWDRDACYVLHCESDVINRAPEKREYDILIKGKVIGKRY